MSTVYRVSVVVPTYQRCHSVHRLLQALIHQTLPPNEYEVIVSIDGSDDGTREMVDNFVGPYRLRAIWQPNQGRAAACNTGIREAEGELIVLLDDDMEPTPTFLEVHCRAHTQGQRLGVMGAVPISFDDSSPPVVQYIGAKFNQHLEQLAQPDHELQLRDFYSGNFSIRREILLEVGSFDEAFKIYGNEDLELSLRLQRAGVWLLYNAEAVAHQHYTKGFSGLARDHIAKGKMAVLLARKHPSTFSGLKLSQYEEGSRKWRLLRAGLLGLSRIWTLTPSWMMWFVTWLERRRPLRMSLYYNRALDYFYWLGAREAMREHRDTGHEVSVQPSSSGRYWL